jgi:biotin transport system substrate-specific component
VIGAIPVAHTSAPTLAIQFRAMAHTVAPATFVDTLAARGAASAPAAAIRAASVLFVAALTAAAAQISVPLPFTDVPFTFQPMVVLIGGLALGPRLGSASQILFLAAGIAGLPVFAASAALPPGAMRLLGPTGGYLLAYPIAAFVVGSLAARGFDRRYLTSIVAMLAGLAVVYASGVTWLAYFARPVVQAAPAGFQAALAAGVYPFVAADLLKLFAAAGVMPAVWRLVGRAERR